MKTTLCIAGLLLFGLLTAFKKRNNHAIPFSDVKKITKEGYAYIPSGKTIIGQDTVSCHGFFMMQEEVSNASYKEYLSDLKNNNRLEEYQQALPDTGKWKSGFASAEKYVQYYFSHPAYQRYPIVNITKNQAEKYCEWLTAVWRQKIKNETLVFRLPTRAEFLRAANGNTLKRPYAWKGPYLRKSDGQYQCNFLAIDAGSISRDPETGKLVVMPLQTDFLDAGGDYADLLAPARSYWPNEFGIYNLNGNASEMLQETGLAAGGDWKSPGYDVRNESVKSFTEANPTVGFRPVMTFVDTQTKLR